MAKATLIILHGWMSKISRWQHLIELLQKKFRVYFPVLPGFGKEKLKWSWQLDDYADWLTGYLKQNKIKRPILVAHSNGGRVAIKAVAEGLAIEKLILIASAGIKSKKNLKKRLCFLLAKTGKCFFLLPPFSFIQKPLRWFFYTLIGEKDYYRASGYLKPTLVNLINQDLEPFLSQLKIPTLLLWGKKDKLTPLQHAYIFKKKIKDARLIVYPSAGHDLPFSLSDKIAAQIIAFTK